HDLADLAEVGVEEALLVVREAPLRDDRSAARDDAGHALGGEGDVAQEDAGVHGEIVHTLLRLLDQRVAIDLPGQLLGAAAALLRSLIDRHGVDRRGGVGRIPPGGSWICFPVETSITVAAPQSVAHCSFATSSSIEELTAELPM